MATDDRGDRVQRGHQPIIVRLAGATKTYQTGSRVVEALRSVDLEVHAGEWVSILGPSGCGKSTLLNLLSGIDRPTAGLIEVGGRNLGAMNEEALARWRGRATGIVFQFFQLMPTLTAFENVLLPMQLADRHADAGRARQLLRQVGIEHLADRLPNELSGGEQQRTAIARALANDPPLILADEPTGNLDSATGEEILGLLGEASRRGKTLIVVTHDRTVAQRGSRTIEMRDGRIVSDEPAASGSLAAHTWSEQASR